VNGKKGLSRTFQEVMAEAGIETILGEEKEGAGRRFSKLSFHSLRHSAVSALANAGVAPELRRKLTNHKSATVHEGYTHHELKPLRDAIEKLPKL
jgi:integrase